MIGNNVQSNAFVRTYEAMTEAEQDALAESLRIPRSQMKGRLARAMGGVGENILVAPNLNPRSYDKRVRRLLDEGAL